MGSDRYDPEVMAIKTIGKSLEKLDDHAAARRVIEWAANKFHTNYASTMEDALHQIETKVLGSAKSALDQAQKVLSLAQEALNKATDTGRKAIELKEKLEQHIKEIDNGNPPKF